MIELNEKASIYAEENVINVLKEAFAKVYADGYRDGYKDCLEHVSVNLHISNTEYVDLGLPSGTLWSADYEKEGDDNIFLSYDKADKYDIPTKEQFNELLKTCHWEFKYINSAKRQYVCIGPNGNHIVFHSRGYKLAGTTRESEKIIFWIKTNTEATTKEAVCLYYHNGQIKTIIESFSGNMLPLRLVKKI